MGRAGRAGEVRLSRPEDADDAGQGRDAAQTARRSRSTSRAIPLDDKKTYEMLGRGETVGVFQVESAGMQKALVDMRADRFEDLIALVALYRPGPMANIPVYCARKLGAGKGRIRPSATGADSQGHVRRHHLSGAGSADRQGSCRLQSGAGRYPAPRDGQEDQGRDGRAARALRHRRCRARDQQARRRFESSTPAPNSPNTASTNPIRRLTRSSPTRPRGSRPITPSNSSPRR